MIPRSALLGSGLALTAYMWRAGQARSRRREQRLREQLDREVQLRYGFLRALGLPLHSERELERDLWARAYQGDEGAEEILNAYYLAQSAADSAQAAQNPDLHKRRKRGRRQNQHQ